MSRGCSPVRSPHSLSLSLSLLAASVDVSLSLPQCLPSCLSLKGGRPSDPLSSLCLPLSTALPACLSPRLPASLPRYSLLTRGRRRLIWMPFSLLSVRFETATDRARNGLTPLHFAVMTGRASLVETLLNSGANIHAAVTSNIPTVTIMKLATPLSLAVSFARDAEVIDLLLRRGAEPLQAVTFTGSTAVHFSILNANMTAVRALMRHDPSLLGRPNRMGAVPIALGTMMGRYQFYQELSEEFPRETLSALRDHDPKYARMHARGGNHPRVAVPPCYRYRYRC